MKSSVKIVTDISQSQSHSSPFFFAADNMLQLNLFTALIHGAGDEILFRDQHQCIAAMIAATYNSASSFLRALEPRNESVSKNTSWLLFFSIRTETAKMLQSLSTLLQWPCLNLFIDSQNQPYQPINIFIH